eukprot:9150911-Lingulodinium_polyedra.AAC.1
MVRSSRPSAAAALRESHVSRTPCEHQNWRAHGVREACDLRAVAAASGRFDRIIAHGFNHCAE